MFAQNPDGSVAFARYATDGILSGGKITRGAKDVQLKTTGNLKFPTLPKLRLNPDETWGEVVRRKNNANPGSGDALQAKVMKFLDRKAAFEGRYTRGSSLNEKRAGLTKWRKFIAQSDPELLAWAQMHDRTHTAAKEHQYDEETGQKISVAAVQADPSANYAEEWGFTNENVSNTGTRPSTKGKSDITRKIKEKPIGFKGPAIGSTADAGRKGARMNFKGLLRKQNTRRSDYVDPSWGDQPESPAAAPEPPVALPQEPAIGSTADAGRTGARMDLRGMVAQSLAQYAQALPTWSGGPQPMSDSVVEYVEPPTISYANYPVGTAANVAADRVNQLTSSMLVDTDDDTPIAHLQEQLAARLAQQQAAKTMSSAVEAAQSRGFAQTIDSKDSNPRLTTQVSIGQHTRAPPRAASMLSEDSPEERVRIATALMRDQTRTRDLDAEMQRLAQEREQTEDKFRSMPSTDFLDLIGDTPGDTDVLEDDVTQSGYPRRVAALGPGFVAGPPAETTPSVFEIKVVQDPKLTAEALPLQRSEGPDRRDYISRKRSQSFRQGTMPRTSRDTADVPTSVILPGYTSTQETAQLPPRTTTSITEMPDPLEGPFSYTPKTSRDPRELSEDMRVQAETSETQAKPEDFEIQGDSDDDTASETGTMVGDSDDDSVRSEVGDQLIDTDDPPKPVLSVDQQKLVAQVKAMTTANTQAVAAGATADGIGGPAIAQDVDAAGNPIIQSVAIQGIPSNRVPGGVQNQWGVQSYGIVPAVDTEDATDNTKLRQGLVQERRLAESAYIDPTLAPVEEYLSSYQAPIPGYTPYMYGSYI